MTKKSIDLTYAKSGLSFFNKIGSTKQITDQYKRQGSISTFDAKDDIEIGRGKNYALLPELAVLVAQGQKITIESFRRSLSNNGISDIGFQNKILSFLLQNRSGVGFALGEIINTEFDMRYLMDQKTIRFQMTIDENGHANLTFHAIWKRTSEERQNDPAFGVTATFIISPEMITITSCEFTQESNHPEDAAVFAEFENKQQNIIEQLITFIQRCFGYNSELRLEEKSEQDQSWAPR